MSALSHVMLGWLHEQVEQVTTGAATPLRRPPIIPTQDDESPDVVDAEGWVINGPA